MGSWLTLQVPALGRGHVVQRGALAQLQRADIDNNGPSIFRRDLGSIVFHFAETVGDDIEQKTNGSLSQSVDMVGRRRPPEPSFDDDSLPITGLTVAWRAIDIEALSATIEQRPRQRNRNGIDHLPVRFPGKESFLTGLVATVHSSWGNRARRTTIGKEVAWVKRKILGLIRHLLPA